VFQLHSPVPVPTPASSSLHPVHSTCTPAPDVPRAAVYDSPHPKDDPLTATTSATKDADSSDPFVRLADKLRPIPALIYSLLYSPFATPFLEMEYGTAAARILNTLMQNPSFDDRLRAILPVPSCEHCESNAGTALPTSSRTQREWHGEDFNPNHPVHLCPDCTVEHHQYWDDMWADYRASVV